MFQGEWGGEPPTQASDEIPYEIFLPFLLPNRMRKLKMRQAGKRWGVWEMEVFGLVDGRLRNGSDRDDAYWFWVLA
jgi:hypothetical protein